jgi:cob(I)alamin adenosyltransferase
MPRRVVSNVPIPFAVTVNVHKMSITTKRGDKGISHWNNQSIHKDNILIETIGCLDELQAAIGLSGLELPEVMVDLWGVMGEVSMGTKFEKLDERIDLMEHEIERMEDTLPKLEKFLIFKKEKAVKLNWLRTLVRRAERRVVALSKKESINPKLMAYINRLSDYLFMLARREEGE